jgi:hypothetical protein
MFYITDDHFTILGRQACQSLGLIKRVDILAASSIHTAPVGSKKELLKSYQDVFQGIGAYGKEYHIQLREDANPVVQQSRTFPYAKQSKLKETTEGLKHKGIIADVEEPTDWVHNLVVTDESISVPQASQQGYQSRGVPNSDTGRCQSPHCWKCTIYRRRHA